MVEEQVKMTLGEHLDELRARLLRALAGVLVGMIVCFFLGEHLFRVMFWPLNVATQGQPPKLYFTSPPEAFSTYLRVCLIAGAILASPYGLYQMWLFIGAGLYAHERLAVRKYLLPSIGLFILGVAFFVMIVAPLVIGFFLHFAKHSFPGPMNVGVPWLGKYLGRPDVGAATTQPAASSGFVLPWLTLGNYVSFVATLSLVFGLGFQTPLVVLFLGRTGIVPIPAMKHFRRYVFFVILLVSAIVTPADVPSMVALAGPMYLLYEVGLLFAARGRRLPEA
jgi:sec-independent protein translocase protein TatC